MTNQFNGFPKEAIQFLADIGSNNNKAWFEANKPIYQAALIEPAQDFIEAIGSQLTEILPSIRYDTRTNGSGSLMRIYRDTRFSKDKTPYKTSISGMWWLGAGKKTRHPAFGFHMESTGMELMAGVFTLDKKMLHLYREAVAGSAGEDLANILDELGNAGYQISEPSYKQVPKEYPEDHPRADLLRQRGLYVNPTGLSADLAQTPDIVEAVMQHFKTMAPVVRWLAENIN